MSLVHTQYGKIGKLISRQIDSIAEAQPPFVRDQGRHIPLRPVGSEWLGCILYLLYMTHLYSGRLIRGARAKRAAKHINLGGGGVGVVH